MASKLPDPPRSPSEHSEAASMPASPDNPTLSNYHEEISTPYQQAARGIYYRETPFTQVFSNDDHGYPEQQGYKWPTTRIHASNVVAPPQSTRLMQVHLPSASNSTVSSTNGDHHEHRASPFMTFLKAFIVILLCAIYPPVIIFFGLYWLVASDRISLLRLTLASVMVYSGTSIGTLVIFGFLLFLLLFLVCTGPVGMVIIASLSVFLVAILGCFAWIPLIFFRWLFGGSGRGSKGQRKHHKRFVYKVKEAKRYR